jgi:predicted nucleic acid-binding protein
MDSSTIVKLYVDEDGSVNVRSALESASATASCLAAYAEVRAAFAAGRRDRKIRTIPRFEQAKADFERDWSEFFQILIDAELVNRAGELAEQRALTGFDAIHLAAALALRDATPEEVQISTWDRRLASAAVVEGFALAHEVNS